MVRPKVGANTSGNHDVSAWKPALRPVNGTKPTCCRYRGHAPNLELASPAPSRSSRKSVRRSRTRGVYTGASIPLRGSEKDAGPPTTHRWRACECSAPAARRVGLRERGRWLAGAARVLVSRRCIDRVADPAESVATSRRPRGMGDHDGPDATRTRQEVPSSDVAGEIAQGTRRQPGKSAPTERGLHPWWNPSGAAADPRAVARDRGAARSAGELACAMKGIPLAVDSHKDAKSGQGSM